MKTIVLILSLIVAVLSSAMAQEMDDAALDSLAAVYYTLDDGDSTKLRICDDIAQGHYNVDSTIAWAERQIRLAKIQENALKEAKALGYLSWAYYFQCKFLEANNCNFRAILIADSIENDDIKAENYRSLGENYSFINDFQQSHQYFSIAMDLYDKIQDSVMIAACARAMARDFYNQKMFNQAEEYYRKAIVIDSLAGDADYLLDDHLGLAEMFMTQYLQNGSSPNFNLLKKARLEIALGDSAKSDYIYYLNATKEAWASLLALEAFGYGYEGERLQQVLDSIRQFYEEGYAIVDKLNSRDRYNFDVCKANYLTLSRQYSEAKHVLDSLLASLDKDVIDLAYVRKLYTACDNYYKSVGDYKNAYCYKSKFYEFINNQSSINYAVKAAQDIAQSRFDEQMNEHAEKEAQRKRRVKYGSIAVSLILLFALYEIFMTRRHNRILNNKNELLETQKSEINTQNAQIMDSISYASLIQRALMPDDAQMKKIFSDFYVIYRPLNIVAGDFYWMASVDKYKIVVGADSTGHGVPGAFVSVLGINLLNDLAPLVMSNNGSPAQILNEMRRRLMSALGQDRERFEHGEKINMDGIDLALAIIDTEANTLKYAGAYRPLWVFDGNGITTLKPDKMPIGVYVGDQHDFSEQTLQVKPGDCLYMFSDGITDQFGYLDDTKTSYKHYSVKRLLETVGKIADKPFSEQHQILESTIDTWQNGYQQLDDILFLAVKI
ncbi:MAG: SpoIIE family protein phosphatase [Bacteroidales bacterium]|nr:SpoIIE family protein phosphatase [Bacteroidales bacterium]